MDLMIDIETLGTGSNAAVVQLAAAWFERGDPNTQGEFSIYMKPTAGTETDIDTVFWWLEQDYEARLRLLDGVKDAVYDTVAYYKFTQWVGRIPEESDTLIWCQGMDFDIPLVRNGITRCMQNPIIIDGEPLLSPLFNPMDHRRGRDTRTAYTLAAYDYKAEPLKEGEEKHDALTDVRRQIRSLAAAMSRLGPV